MENLRRFTSTKAYEDNLKIFFNNNPDAFNRQDKPDTNIANVLDKKKKLLKILIICMNNIHKVDGNIIALIALIVPEVSLQKHPKI